jgi:hypothetical protein
MREGHSKLSRASLVFAAVLTAAGVALPQDGTGRSDSVERPAAARKIKAPNRPYVRASIAVRPEPVRRIELGKLALSVNEGDSRVEISQVGVPAGPADVIPVPSRSSSLIVRTLPAGSYRVTVSKYGYASEMREVEISDGKRQRLAVYLKPEMAFLTVGTSVPDARIDIESVGSYNREIHRLILKPGRYRLSVSRRGYTPQTVAVELKSAGREESVHVVLKPLPLDKLLADANDNFAKGNYEAARELAGDVLKLNPAHGRANLIYGMAEMRSGRDGAEYLVRAVRGGETYRIPMKLQDPRGAGLLDAELAVDREDISINSPGRTDLDLTILKENVSALNLFSEQGFIVVAGKTEFHGRIVQPNLRVHPHDIVAEPAAGTTRCAGEECSRKLAELARMLNAWRADGTGRK